jgi:hypothetical protein
MWFALVCWGGHDQGDDCYEEARFRNGRGACSPEHGWLRAIRGKGQSPSTRRYQGLIAGTALEGPGHGGTGPLLFGIAPAQGGAYAPDSGSGASTRLRDRACPQPGLPHCRVRSSALASRTMYSSETRPSPTGNEASHLTHPNLLC